jgi:hypothetical protein
MHFRNGASSLAHLSGQQGCVHKFVDMGLVEIVSDVLIGDVHRRYGLVNNFLALENNSAAKG